MHLGGGTPRPRARSWTMPKRILQLAAGTSLGLLIALLIARPDVGGAARPGQEFLLPSPLPAPDAELVAHTGETVRLSELRRDRTLVLFFGYTNCPDICPLTMAALGRARALLGEDAERVTGVLITVDPARDSVAQLASYLARFPPGLLGLTGSPDALAEVARGYLVTVAPSAPATTAAAPAPDAHAGHAPAAAAPGGGYLVDHTGRAYVVHEGAVRMTFPPMTDAAQMAAGLKLLLDP